MIWYSRPKTQHHLRTDRITYSGIVAERCIEEPDPSASCLTKSTMRYKYRMAELYDAPPPESFLEAGATLTFQRLVQKYFG